MIPALPLDPPVLQEGVCCAKHPAQRAIYACRACAKPICRICAFAETDGSQFCPDCMMARVEAGPKLPPVPQAGVPAGVKCVQHPGVDATQRCKLCGAFMCATCDFLLPEGFHVCPACVAAPRTAMSPKRKKLLIGSYALAIWSTFGMAALLAGAFARFANPRDAEALGMALMLFVFFPAIGGMGIAMTVKDRRLTNPPSVWIALVWNSLITLAFIALIIIGHARK